MKWITSGNPLKRVPQARCKGAHQARQVEAVQEFYHTLSVQSMKAQSCKDRKSHY